MKDRKVYECECYLKEGILELIDDTFYRCDTCRMCFSKEEVEQGEYPSEPKE
jgi:hypothetical protein